MWPGTWGALRISNHIKHTQIYSVACWLSSTVAVVARVQSLCVCLCYFHTFFIALVSLSESVVLTSYSLFGLATQSCKMGAAHRICFDFFLKKSVSLSNTSLHQCAYRIFHNFWCKKSVRRCFQKDDNASFNSMYYVVVSIKNFQRIWSAIDILSAKTRYVYDTGLKPYQRTRYEKPKHKNNDTNLWNKYIPRRKNIISLS